MYQLRPYQQKAVEDAIEWVKSTLEPGLIESYTGSGKSLIIAEIAKRITEYTNKKVLVLQPNKELLLQNVDKYKLTGNKCSLFSASAGSRSVRHNVIYGTAQTIKNDLDKFCEKFCLVILDEADASLTPTILGIINSIKIKNPNLRVLGLTSSPYKLGRGFIYAMDINGKPVPKSKTKDPFFSKQIVHISGRYLLEQGYVSPITIGSINESYDTSGLEINSMGKFTSDSVDKAFVGMGRKTSSICNDFVTQTSNQGRISGLVFASTHKHAEEIYESLPRKITAIVTDKTTQRERDRIVKAHYNLHTKYLINVGIFQRGTDFPRLDFIALLRATESSALLHQIIGRLARIHPDKKDGMIFDYARNIERHHQDGDIFSPDIKTWGKSSDRSEITAICPICSTENVFSARKNDEGFSIDSQGFFVDLMGARIKTAYGDYPAHFGRRCYGKELIRGKFERCGYFYTHKVCPVCSEKCDISARHCPNKHELVDPNNSLIDTYKPAVKDPYQQQTERVIAWHTKKTKSKNNEDMLVVNYITENKKLVIFYLVRRPEYSELVKATNGGEKKPETLTYIKDVKTGYYRALGYNQL